MHAALAVGWEEQESYVEADLWLQSPWGVGLQTPLLCVFVTHCTTCVQYF